MFTSLAQRRHREANMWFVHSQELMNKIQPEDGLVSCCHPQQQSKTKYHYSLFVPHEDYCVSEDKLPFIFSSYWALFHELSSKLTNWICLQLHSIRGRETPERWCGGETFHEIKCFKNLWIRRLNGKFWAEFVLSERSNKLHYL